VSLFDKLFLLTPLSRSHKKVLEHVGDKAPEEALRIYEKEFNRYRRAKIIQINLRVLLMASFVTSIATTLGLPQAEIIQKVASIIGAGALFMFYMLFTYVVVLYKESYHVEREILISETDIDRELEDLEIEE
jgi:hypothetical protein